MIVKILPDHEDEPHHGVHRGGRAQRHLAAFHHQTFHHRVHPVLKKSQILKMLKKEKKKLFKHSAFENKIP